MIGGSAVLRGGASADYFRDPALYQEVQHFPAWVYALTAIPGLFLLTGATRQLGLGRPFGDRPMSDAGLAVLTLAVVSLPFLLYGLILRMETLAEPAGLTVRFGTLGWVHRTVGTGDIASVSVVSYRPIRDFGGWGLRYAKGLWCYSTRGNRGVLVVTKQGKRFIVGSQNPELLESVLKGLIRPAA